MTNYLVDTSAWVEYIRDTSSPACEFVDQLIRREEDLFLTEPVIMELLAGGGPKTISRLEKMVGAFPVLRVDAAIDYHEAARIYRIVRASGDTPRNHVDCLVAAVAARTEAVVVHADRDFRIIARRYPLELAPG